jgi:hypothetical protein
MEKVMDGTKVLIFVATKRTADNLTRMLRQDGWPARAIHGTDCLPRLLHRLALSSCACSHSLLYSVLIDR